MATVAVATRRAGPRPFPFLALPTVRGRSSRTLPAPYWALCGAGLASSVGDGAVLVAFPLLASTLTRDPRLLAGVAVAQRLPWLILSLFTGALADRLDRRRFLAGTEALRMMTMAALAGALAVRFHPLLAMYAGAFALGAFETAFSAASGALVPELVRTEQLGRANGYLYAAQMSGEGFLGPALGGLLAAVALALPFLFDGATFAVSAVILLGALPAARRGGRGGLLPSDEGVPTAGATLTTRRAAGMAEGVRWFLGNPAVRLLAAFISCMAFCQTAVFGVLVLWAQRYLHSSRAGYGALISVAAVGVVGAALAAGRLLERVSPSRLLMAVGAGAALAYLVLGTTTSAVLAAGALLVEGAAVSMGNVVSAALRQRLIPAEMLGRVGNAMRMCIFGAMPAGALAGGMAAGVIGLRGTFMAAGAAQLAAVVLVGRLLPRRLG